MEIHSNKILRKNKIIFETFKFYSASLNLVSELRAFYDLLIKIKKFEPDLIHSATAKGIIYGGLISLILNIKGIVFFISGMGFCIQIDLLLRRNYLNQYMFLLKDSIFKKIKY